ncbi:MAG: mechanosensitive ion channel family protein [Alphaproteobacteria bacterium]
MADLWLTANNYLTQLIQLIDWPRTAAAAAIIVLVLVFRRLLARLLIAAVVAVLKRAGVSVREQTILAQRAPAALFNAGFGVFIGLEVLKLADVWAMFGARLSKTMMVVAIFWAVHALVKPLSLRLEPLRAVLNVALVDWLVKAAQFAAVFVGGAAVLQIWGIEVGPILAGLGLFGVALALGAQDLFKNLIAGMAIIVERRFNPGDWIRVDDTIEGTVKEIGFRSTRISRSDMASVYIPNTQLSDGALVNFRDRAHRRIYWKIGVVYSTTIDQLAEIRDGIEAYIAASPDFAQPPTAGLYVRVDAFGASAIDILVYCFTKGPAYADYLVVKERLAFEIMSIVAKAGSDFAFPSATIYIEATESAGPERFVAADN